MCPINGFMIRRPASLHRVRAGPVPRLQRYYQDATTSCRPSRRTSLPSLGGTLGTPHLRSGQPETSQPTDQECFGCGHPHHRAIRWRRQDLPSSRGTPIARLPCSLTPVGRSSQTYAGRPYSPRFRYDEGANIIALSRLYSMAFELAVYASPCGSPHPAQDSLPGAGQAFLDGLAYPQGSFERFQSYILHLIPLPQAWLGANPIGRRLGREIKPTAEH